MPSAVSQYCHYSRYHQPLQDIFEPKHQALLSSPAIPQQINCPSNPFLNQQAKRCEPFQSFFIRSTSPPRHFQTDTPSSVIQSRHSSLDSSFINNSSGIKQFLSASDHASSSSFFAFCLDIPISKAFFYI